jgi:hypothetical protein
MGKRRDMTKAQFKTACERHGFKRALGGFFGYYEIGNGVSASVLNAGPTRREQLAYLIKESEKRKQAS